MVTVHSHIHSSEGSDKSASLFPYPTFHFAGIWETSSKRVWYYLRIFLGTKSSKGNMSIMFMISPISAGSSTVLLVKYVVLFKSDDSAAHDAGGPDVSYTEVPTDLDLLKLLKSMIQLLNLQSGFHAKVTNLASEKETNHVSHK